MIKDALQKPEINFWIGLIIPLIAISVAFGTLKNDVAHVERMAIALQNEYNNQRLVNEEIKVRLAEIQKDILYIRTEIEKIN